MLSVLVWVSSIFRYFCGYYGVVVYGRRYYNVLYSLNSNRSRYGAGVYLLRYQDVVRAISNRYRSRPLLLPYASGASLILQ